ncbi:MAG: MFS transporter [Devosiaceae bacterium]|nr:MFS transporter [Devosiaceae bacterium MH13]
MTASIFAMSLWFVAAAVLPGMTTEFALSAGQQAALSSGVQGGFVIGALFLAVTGLPDRLDPRVVFSVCAVLAGLANALLLVVPLDGATAVALRVATGALLAGVYPVGMKIAVGWGAKDRGLLVGLLVAAVAMGSASPHALALLGGADWRSTVMLASALSVAAGFLVFGARLGPHHARAARFNPRAIRTAWTNRGVRLAIIGYLGHMWELYAMWAWIAVIAAASFSAQMGAEAGARVATLTAFGVIALGSVVCIPTGWLADRVGKAQVAGGAMLISGAFALIAAVTFGGPLWVVIPVLLIWGASVIPDSPQLSALVADHAPADQAGSLLTLQTALGFGLTMITVQAAPLLTAQWGWPTVLVLMALGPVVGIAAMRALIRLPEKPAP